jgi:hypothetical protein
MTYENYEADTESGTFGRVCQICTFDESVAWFEDVPEFAIDPLPTDFRPATVCGKCGAVYGPNFVHDRARTSLYAARLARLQRAN